MNKRIVEICTTHNIYTLSNLVTNDGEIKKLNQIVEMNSPIYKSQYLNCVSFTKSIPRVWLNLLHSESYELTEEYSNAIIIDGNTVNVESLNSRCINCILIKHISDSPTAKEKLESKYKDKIEWNEICKILIKTSIYTKLREFQYKIIHNYLPVNHNLFKWKVSDSNRCSYCFNESETIEHLFTHVILQ